MKLPDPNISPCRTGVEPAGDGLDLMSRLVLEQVDSKVTIVEIGEVCGFDVQLVQRIVQNLAEQNLVRFAERARAEAAGSGGRPVNTTAKQTEEKRQAVEKLEREIEEKYSSLKTTNYYDLLLVDPEADRKEITKRYFDLSKRFHPDRAFAGVSDEAKKKTAVVFRMLTKAYDTLCNADRRAEYDEYIADELKLRAIEKQLTAAVDEKMAQSEPPFQAAAPVEEESPNPSVSPEPDVPVKIAARARPVKTVTVRRPEPIQRPVPISRPVAPVEIPVSEPPEQEPPRPQPQHDKRRQHWRRRRANRAMARMLGKPTSSPAPPAQYQTRIEEAELAVEQEQYPKAIQILKKVLLFDRSNERAQELLERAETESKKMLAKGYLRQGRYEKRNGQFEKARASFDRALTVDPDNLDAQHMLAELLVETGKEMAYARALIKSIITSGGRKARYFATLGEIYLISNDWVRAKEAFERAISLEPENKTYRKRLKSCIK